MHWMRVKEMVDEKCSREDSDQVMCRQYSSECGLKTKCLWANFALGQVSSIQILREAMHHSNFGDTVKYFSPNIGHALVSRKRRRGLCSLGSKKEKNVKKKRS